MIVLILWIACLILGVAVGLNYAWIYRFLLSLEIWIIGKFGKIEEL